MLALAASALSGCGGGGSTSSDTSFIQVPSFGPSSAPTPPVVVDQSLLQATPVSLPDLRPYFDQLCGDATQVRDLLTPDLNKDGKKDIVVTMNCMQPTFGVVVIGPVKAGFVAFLQNSDGTFRLGTQSVFGQDIVRTSGYIINAIQDDFNKDGYDDFVLALNREDGRAYSDQYASNFNDQNVFVTSTGNGSYKIISQGKSAWHYVLRTMDNASGGKDLVNQPANEHWTYDNGWKQLASLDWSAPGTVFLDREAPNQASTSAINPYWVGSDFGVSLYTRNQDWSLTDKLLFGSVQNVPWITWSKERSTVALVTINNMKYVNVTIEVSCSMNTDQGQIALFALQSSPVSNSYVDGTVLVEGDDKTIMPPQTNLIGFRKSNGKLIQLDLKISNQEKEVNPLRLYCKDINGDGNSDIVVSDWRTGKSPYVYINAGSGSFSRINPTNLPNVNNPDYSGEAFIYTDLHGDGFADFISYPTAGLTNSGIGKSVILKLYKGGRYARSGDFM